MRIIIVYLSIFLSFLPPLTRASGFTNYSQGAEEAGGPAFAHVVSPAANFWNPALLTGLDGTRVQVGTSIISPTREMRSGATGVTYETREKTSLVPQLYVAHAIGDRIGIGFYANSPFGLDGEWEEGWEGRYITTESRLSTMEAGFNVAYRLLPSLSLGGGVRYLSADGVLQRNLDLRRFGLPDGTQRFSGEDSRLLWQVGLLAELAPGVNLGVNYRSGTDLRLDGDLTFSDVPAALRAGLPDTRGTAGITIPAQAFGGIAVQRGPWLAELGVRWEQWSDYQSLTIELERPVLGATRRLEPRGWKDTLTALAGLTYRLRPDLSLRLGYIYEPSAVPDETLEYSVTDTRKQFLTVGVRWQAWERTRLALAYTHGFYDDRYKGNGVGTQWGAAANGWLDQEMDIVALSVTHGF